jgi:glutathione S-transferase
MYTLHIANKNYSSWSLRPWILMTELAIPFQEIVSPFNEGSNWDTFRKFSPSGLVPCLLAGDETIWDSLGITEYLAESHNNIWPEDKAARTWARCASSEMHSGFSALREICPMNCGIMAELKDQPGSLVRNLERLDELWNEGFTRFDGPFLSGKHFTAVDAFFTPVAFRVRSYNLKLSDQSLEYVRRILSLTSVQKWEQEALQEDWREPGHEKDIAKYAVIHEDRRKNE